MDDDARFDRQRRNVMVTSSLIIAAWFVKADFAKLSFFGLTADAPHKIAILWALLIAYFLWRLYQVSGKTQVDEKQALFMEILKERLTETGRKEVIKEKKEEHKSKPRPSWKLISLIVIPIQDEVTYEGYKFTANFYVGCKWNAPEGAESNENGNRQKSYVVGQPEHTRAVWHTKILVKLKRKTFTEYELPYLLGVIGILVGAFGFWG